MLIFCCGSAAGVFQKSLKVVVTEFFYVVAVVFVFLSGIDLIRI